MMQIKLKTAKFQDMVSRAVKGASNNKLLPITGLMAVELSEDNVLTLTTSDLSNYLKIRERQVEGDPFYVVVSVDVFSKLVAKTTSEFITLTLTDTGLEVKGNGTYNIKLPLDEDGKLVRFPEYKMPASESVTVHTNVLKNILAYNKAALAETLEAPCYTGYYFGDRGVVTTDTFKICVNEREPIFSRPTLLPAELVSLLALVTSETVDVTVGKNTVQFTSPDCVIFGHELEGVEDFSIDAILGLVDTQFTSMCKLPKQAFIAALDRLNLFVTTYDKNGVYLTFTNEGVMVNSKQNTGSELIRYQGSENFVPFSCCADIQLLRSQIVAQADELIEMWYGGTEVAIKMVSGKVTQIVALIEDERTGE
jgi:DNA polymerase III sliding clamp (beta) subunit (PCNA family)